MADEDKERIEDVVPEEVETSNWETLTEEDEKYIEKIEMLEEDAEIAEDAEVSEDAESTGMTEVERPVINEEIANRVAEEEQKDKGKEYGMRFHMFWVQFGLPLAVMWAGLDALMAAFALFQGNGGALANVLIRGAVLFFGIPALKGLRKFTRVSYIKHTTLCFYSLAVKVVNLVMVALNFMAAPQYASDFYAEQAEKFIADGVTEAMLLGDLQMQLTLQVVINVVTFVFWLLIYRYYKHRRKYFTYK